MKALLVNFTSGSEEASKLDTNLDDKARAELLIHDALEEGVDIILGLSMSQTMINRVDSILLPQGWRRSLSPEYRKLSQGRKARYTQLVVTYVSPQIKSAQMIRFEDSQIYDMRFRYNTVKVSGIFIRSIHIPAAREGNNRYEFQLERQSRMLSWELDLQNTIPEDTIVTGDFNLSNPKRAYKKILKGKTYQGIQLDHVLVSPGMENRVKATIFDPHQRTGKITDHTPILINII